MVAVAASALRRRRLLVVHEQVTTMLASMAASPAKTEKSKITQSRVLTLLQYYRMVEAKVMGAWRRSVPFGHALTASAAPRPLRLALSASKP